MLQQVLQMLALLGFKPTKVLEPTNTSSSVLTTLSLLKLAA
jgi:hypothetical protein